MERTNGKTRTNSAWPRVRSIGAGVAGATQVLGLVAVLGCGAGPGPGSDGTPAEPGVARGAVEVLRTGLAADRAPREAGLDQPMEAAHRPKSPAVASRVPDPAGPDSPAPKVIRVTTGAPGSRVTPAIPGEFLRVELDVRFDPASDEIRPLYRRAVADLAGLLTEYPDLTAVIEGHADSTGSAARNRALSRRRAQAVVRLLTVRHGIDAARLTAVGLGAARPVAPNDTVEGRAHNRRVTAVLAGR